MHDTPTHRPHNSPPPCPHCGQPMRLARSVPAIGGLPELRTFECRPCVVSLTTAVECRHDGAVCDDFAEAC